MAMVVVEGKQYKCGGGGGAGGEAKNNRNVVVVVVSGFIASNY